MKKLYGYIECCFNWRVVAGLAVAAAGLFILAPKFAAANLLVLAALVCPLSMIWMMWSMRNSNSTPGANPAVNSDLEGLTREQHLELLERQLQRVQAQQTAIAGQLSDHAERDQSRRVAAVAGNSGKVSRN